MDPTNGEPAEAKVQARISEAKTTNIVNLEGLDLEEVPSSLFSAVRERSLPQPKELHLQKNKIEQVPEELGDQLVQLRALLLHNNHICSLPKQLCQLRFLERLGLCSPPPPPNLLIPILILLLYVAVSFDLMCLHSSL